MLSPGRSIRHSLKFWKWGSWLMEDSYEAPPSASERGRWMHHATSEDLASRKGVKPAPGTPGSSSDWNHVGEDEPVAFNGLPHNDIQGSCEAGTVYNEGVELAILTAGID